MHQIDPPLTLYNDCVGVIIGGPWVLPTSRPVCLRPTLLRKQYKEFAEKINAALAWNVYSMEIIFFYLVTIVIPPFSATLMV